MDETLENLFSKLSISEVKKLEITAPQQVKVNNDFIINLSQATGKPIRDKSLLSVPYKLFDVEENTAEYEIVKQQFKKKNKKVYKLAYIERVENVFLYLQYKLNTLLNRHYEGITVFHGTKAKNVDSICKNNFNWRLYGLAKGHKFGQGVSFSPSAFFSGHFGDKGYNKLTFLVEMQYGLCYPGYPDIVIPPRPYCMSKDTKDEVYVKYEDSTFYPKYLIYYCGKLSRKRK